jgi:hypothetical protein
MPRAIERVDRITFLTEMWNPKRGQHVTVLAKTGWGKTQLLWDLVSETAYNKWQAVVFAMKPRDDTMTRFMKDNQFRMVRHWPPSPSMWNTKPRGYVLWPVFSYDPQTDDAEMQKQFRLAILTSYRRGNRILVADEIDGQTDDLKLKDEWRAIWKRGRSMKTSAWTASQRPFYVPTEAYSQADHLFLGKVPDSRDEKRFGEIGEGDPKELIEYVHGLNEYEFLYIRRAGGMCIVLPS